MDTLKKHKEPLVHVIKIFSRKLVEFLYETYENRVSIRLLETLHDKFGFDKVELEKNFTELEIRDLEIQLITTTGTIIIIINNTYSITILNYHYYFLTEIEDLMCTKFTDSEAKANQYRGKQIKKVMQIVNIQQPIVSFETPPNKNDLMMMSSMMMEGAEEVNEEPGLKMAKLDESVDENLNFIENYFLKKT